MTKEKIGESEEYMMRVEDCLRDAKSSLRKRDFTDYKFRIHCAFVFLEAIQPTGQIELKPNAELRDAAK